MMSCFCGPYLPNSLSAYSVTIREYPPPRQIGDEYSQVTTKLYIWRSRSSRRFNRCCRRASAPNADVSLTVGRLR